jgi:hypothetical protein
MQRSKSLKLFSELIPDVEADPTLCPSQFISRYWDEFEKNQPESSLRGSVFEYMIAAVLCREKILPLYRQAKVSFVPGIDYDFILYSKENGPIVISAKTSLRERWKQADLEAVVLKNVHRKSLTYLVSLDETAVLSRRKHPEETMGINAYVLANTAEFDDLISGLKKLHFTEAPEVNVIESGTLITHSNFKQHFEKG